LAHGNAAVTVGSGAQGRIAIGQSATAGAAAVNYSIAIGSTATSTGSSSIAFGRTATASALQSYAIGFSTSVVGNNDIAIGSAATTTTANSGRIVMGTNATASGDQGVAIGSNTTVAHNNSVAIGRNATTTATNQIMIGNNASGGANQVFCNVGTTGLMESAGYCVTFNQVRASIQPTAGQVVPSGSGFVQVNMATVNYASDYGIPAITSTPSQIQTRANRTMTGYFNINLTFAGAVVGAGYMTIRIQKNTNGAITHMASNMCYIVPGSLSFVFTIPFQDFNQVVPAANVFYFCESDNNAVFGQNYTINPATHFVCQMTN
jgi:autotransporter adhesin